MSLRLSWLLALMAVVAVPISALVSSAIAAERIGLSLPLANRYAPIAKRMLLGAEIAVRKMQADGNNVSLTVADDACDVEQTAATANTLGEAQIVVGPLCFDAARALSAHDAANKTKRPVIAFGTRNKLLQRARQYDELPLYAVANTSTAEAQAFVDLVLPQFVGKPFAILDDGSVHGRSLADDIRLLGEKAGYKPAAVANFRPLQTTQATTLRRLQRSGVEAVIIAAAAEDIVVIAADMKKLGYAWPIALGEQASLLPYLETTPTLPSTTLMVQESVPKPVDDFHLLSELATRGVVPEISHYHGYALAQLAAQANPNPDGSLPDAAYNTVLGPFKFGADGRAILAPFALHRWQGEIFEPVASN